MNKKLEAFGPSADKSSPPASENTRIENTNQCATNLSSSDQLTLRKRRIDDYLNTALSSPVADVAVLGGVNAGLATLELRLSESIAAVLAECKDVREYIDVLPEGVETLLKLSRQIERFIRLANELARS